MSLFSCALALLKACITAVEFEKNGETKCGGMQKLLSIHQLVFVMGLWGDVFNRYADRLISGETL